MSITGCCDRIEVWAALIIGAVGGLFYILGCRVLDRLHIDDPVEAVQVHFFGGIWGTLATGFFDNQEGLFYGRPGCGRYFGYQVVGLVAIFAWVALISLTVLYILNRLNLLRVDKATEIMGCDIAEMGAISEELYRAIRLDSLAIKSHLVKLQESGDQISTPVKVGFGEN